MRTPVLSTFLLVLVTFAAGIGCDPALAANAKKKLADTDDDSSYYSLKEAALEAANDDPWEGFNRPIFDFNLAFDRHIFKPVVEVYEVVPREVRHSVDNVLTNLTEPLNVIHGVLQLDPKITFTSLWRFILNSTFGLAGLNDFAKEGGNLRHTDENMGKTLGYWGVPSGPYVVLPIFGPSSVRDTTGRIADWFADPVGWQETTWASVGHATASGINARSVQSSVIEHLYYQSLDPYVATRSSYRQNEAFKASSRD